MQSILQLPTSELGPVYYKRKLVLYNFTIYEEKKPNKGFCYLWPETCGKRGASEIGTCVLRYLQGLDKKVDRVTLFCQTAAVGKTGINSFEHYCCMQCRRCLLMSLRLNFWYLGTPWWSATQLMHASIEYAQKNLSIFSLHEWINVLKSARRHNPYKVELLEHTDFVDLSACDKSEQIWKWICELAENTCYSCWESPFR